MAACDYSKQNEVDYFTNSTSWLLITDAIPAGSTNFIRLIACAGSLLLGGCGRDDLHTGGLPGHQAELGGQRIELDSHRNALG